jgi:hypothetical protein
MSSVNSCKTYVYMWLCSRTHLKHHERFFIPNYNFYRSDSFPRRKGGTAVAVRKGISHNHVALPPFVSIEARWVCILICNTKGLLAAVYKSPGYTYNDANIVEVLSFRHMSLLAADLKGKLNQLRSSASFLQIQPLHGPNREHCFPQFLYCCVHDCCCVDVIFTVS